MRLGDVADLKNGYAFESSTYDRGGTYHVITIANVQDGYLSLSATKTITELPSDLQKHHRLESGDILISMTGNVGRVCMVSAKKCLLNQRVGKLIPKGIDRPFLYYVVHSRHFLLSMIEMAVGGAQDNLGKPDITGYSCLIPRKSAEQRAITETLSDVDRLLGALETLVAKKRAIKQAAMQQLLTGRTRLPGFSRAWSDRRLTELAAITMGQSPPSIFYNQHGEGLPLIQGNADIEGHRTIDRVWTRQASKRCDLGDLLLTVRAPVGAVAVASKDATLGRGVCGLKPCGDSRFLFHALVNAEDRWLIVEQGSTFTAANSDQVGQFRIRTPDEKNEQIAIAAVLSDMDAEIAALEQRREKTRTIKHGMMQQLLTGRVRLVKAA